MALASTKADYAARYPGVTATGRQASASTGRSVFTVPGKNDEEAERSRPAPARAASPQPRPAAQPAKPSGQRTADKDAAAPDSRSPAVSAKDGKAAGPGAATTGTPASPGPAPAKPPAPGSAAPAAAADAKQAVSAGADDASAPTAATDAAATKGKDETKPTDDKTQASGDAALGLAIDPGMPPIQSQAVAPPPVPTGAANPPQPQGQVPGQALGQNGQASAAQTAAVAVAAGGATGLQRAAGPTGPGKTGSDFEAADKGAADGLSASPESSAGAATVAAALGAQASATAAADTAAPAALSSPAPASATTPSVPLGAVPMTIGLRSLAGANQFEIRLDPKDLGRIDVSLNIDKDLGTVKAHLVVDRPETLALLQRDTGSLQQALAQAGLDAGDGSINLSLRSDSQSNGQNREGGGSDARSTGGSPFPDRAESHLTHDAVPLVALRGLGGIDIRI